MNTHTEVCFSSTFFFHRCGECLVEAYFNSKIAGGEDETVNGFFYALFYSHTSDNFYSILDRILVRFVFIVSAWRRLKAANNVLLSLLMALKLLFKGDLIASRRETSRQLLFSANIVSKPSNVVSVSPVYIFPTHE